MIELIKTDSSDLDFVRLVEKLDSYLAKVDGDDHPFYDQFNGIDDLNYVIVAYKNDTAVGCGAIKEYDSSRMEIKRMWVDPDARENGVASKILKGLETWASDLGCSVIILETGKKLTNAVSLYQKRGYQQIPNYEPYTGIETSICFKRVL